MSEVPFLYINITALCCFTLLFVTFLAAKKTPEIRSFLLLLGDGIAWVGGAVFMRLRLWPGLTFWYYVSVMALFAMELFFYLFFLRFTRQKEPLGVLFWSLVDAVVLILTATGSILRPPVAKKIDKGTVFLYTINWHIIIPVVFFAVFTVYIVRKILCVVHRQGIRSPGLLLVIFGGCTVMAGNMFQVAIPGNMFPYDALGGISFAAFLLIALYQRQMFRLTLIVSRSLLVVMALICVIGEGYLVLPLDRFFIRTMGFSAETSVVFLTILLAGILLGCYLLTKYFIDILFTRQGRQNRLLQQFTAQAAQTLHTGEIMDRLSEAILSEIPVERVYICLPEGDRFTVRHCSTPLDTTSFSISSDSPPVVWLRENTGFLIIREFSASPLYLSVWESEKVLFRRLRIECMAAMKTGGEITGLLLLSAKKNGRPFYCAEIEYLKTITSVAAIAMKNASLYEEMFREARIDALTGVYNYRCFSEQETEQFQKCREECISLLLVDVDDFKLYNQLYGVEAGDNALRRISEEIVRCVNTDGGTVYRTGGKVFAVLLPNQDTRRAVAIAEEIRRRVREIKIPGLHENKSLFVSVGVCTAPSAASTAKELLDNADLATYRAKQGGKNRVAVFQGMREYPDEMSHQVLDHTAAIINQMELRDGDGKQGTIAIISALTAAIDAKDHYTYSHSKNVARYAANLAVAAGLNDDQVKTIYAAGLLHDVGKISIPEDILNKTGKLTEKEFNIMKGHVNNSIKMIRYLPEMDYLVPAVLGHHERWDGKGYPRGIAGEEIPITARCLTVADCFDAMTTDRPYCRKLPREYALQQIREGAGKQFDPRLAAIFIRLVQETNFLPSVQS